MPAFGARPFRIAVWRLMLYDEPTLMNAYLWNPSPHSPTRDHRGRVPGGHRLRAPFRRLPARERRAAGAHGARHAVPVRVLHRARRLNAENAHRHPRGPRRGGNRRPQHDPIPVRARGGRWVCLFLLDQTDALESFESDRRRFFLPYAACLVRRWTAWSPSSRRPPPAASSPRLPSPGCWASIRRPLPLSLPNSTFLRTARSAASGSTRFRRQRAGKLP